MKKVLALMAVVAMIAVSSVAYAQSTFNVGGSVTGDSTFSVCSDVTIPGMSINSSDSGTCAITSYANGAGTMLITMIGTDDGLYSSSQTYSWERLASDEGTIAAGTEDWGFQISDAANYSVGTNDDGTYLNPDGVNGGPYDTGYHTVEPSTGGTADSIIDGTTFPLTTDTFNIVFTAATDTDTPVASDYAETITLTEVYTAA